MVLCATRRGAGLGYLSIAIGLSATVGLPLGAVWCYMRELTWWMAVASVIIGGLAALCARKFYQAAVCSCVCVACSLCLPTLDAAQNPRLLWNLDTFRDLGGILSLIALASCGTVWWVWRPRLNATANMPHGSCGSCGYDLRGNVSGRCPECGTPCERDPAALCGPERASNDDGHGEPRKSKLQD